MPSLLHLCNLQCFDQCSLLRSTMLTSFQFPLPIPWIRQLLTSTHNSLAPQQDFFAPPTRLLGSLLHHLCQGSRSAEWLWKQTKFLLNFVHYKFILSSSFAVCLTKQYYDSSLISSKESSTFLSSHLPEPTSGRVILLPFAQFPKSGLHFCNSHSNVSFTSDYFHTHL